MPTLGVYNQVAWTGVGDADECWIIATYWALVASGVYTREDLPTISQFRAAAGRPDRPGASGGNNTNIMQAIRKLFPEAKAQKYDGGFAAFKNNLKNGYIASLSLSSRLLPKYLQFGFKGSHQVSVILQKGKFYVMNPLAKEGSALIEISEAALRRAAGGWLGDGNFHAVLIKGGQKVVKDIGRALAMVPRFLPPPPEQGANYLDGWTPLKFYRARHREEPD